jgi:hypothetical protein
LIGIVRSTRAAGEHEIVTGAFARGPRATRAG